MTRRKKNPRGDAERRRLERLAAQGDPEAVSRLAAADLRHGVITPVARQLAFAPELVRKTLDQYVWNKVENWSDQYEYAPMRELDDRNALAVAVMQTADEWVGTYQREPTDAWWPHDWVDTVASGEWPEGATVPTVDEALAVLGQIMPPEEALQRVGVVWRGLDEHQRQMWTEHLGLITPTVLQRIESLPPCEVPGCAGGEGRHGHLYGGCDRHGLTRHDGWCEACAAEGGP